MRDLDRWGALCRDSLTLTVTRYRKLTHRKLESFVLSRILVLVSFVLSTTFVPGKTPIADGLPESNQTLCVEMIIDFPGVPRQHEKLPHSHLIFLPFLGGATVQWFKLPVELADTKPTLVFRFKINKMFLPLLHVKIQYFGEPP